MADRTCPNINCKQVFKYPSGLKQHLELSVICGKSKAEITTFFSNFKKDTEQKFSCSRCFTTFVQKCGLNKHIKHSKCGKLNKVLQISKEELDKIITERANQIIDNRIQQQQIQPTQQQINNDNNHHNTTTTNSNNNLIVNNNTIVQHIYPLGFERLPDIPQSRMKRLLTLGDEGVIEIVKLVCEQDENKNFYKLNMNKSNISYLSKEYKVNVCQESELKEKLLKQCVVLTYQMLVACSPLLTNGEIEYINSNLQNISKKMKEEIYDNGLRNIIEYELRNNSKVTKERITKYADVVKCEPAVKKKAIDNCIEILKTKKNTDKNLIPYLTMKRINRRLGDPLEHPDMDEEDAFMDFTLNRFEYTKYYIYWTKRIEDEEQLINTNPNKTIADIINLDSRTKNIHAKMQYMKEINDSIGKVDTNNIPIITINNFYVKIADEYIIENNRKQNMGDRYNYNSEAEETDYIDEEVPEEGEAIAIEDDNELTN